MGEIDNVIQKIPEQPKSYYIHAVVILALMLGFQFLPPFGPVTPIGMQVLGIFLGVIYAWTIGQTIWPSILALLLMGFVGDTNATTVLGAAYGNQTLLMVIGTLVFCYAVSQSGVLAIVARWIVSRKFAKKGPWWLAFAFFVSSAVTGALVLNTLPVVILLWEIFYDVCKQLDLKPYTKYPTMVMIGIVICGYAGSMCVPYSGLCLISFGVLAAIDPTATVPYGAYMGTAIAITIAICCVLPPFYKLIGPKDLPWGNVDIPDQKLDFNTRQKLILGWVLVLVFVMMAPQLMPKDFILTIWLNRLGTTGCIVLVPALMMLTTFKKQQFVDINKGMMFGVTWNLVFLLATALYISGQVASAQTGIATLLTNMFAPLLTGQSPFVVCAIMIALALVITNCINNVVTVTLLTPIAYSYMLATGSNPVILVALIAFVCLQGVVMPAGSVCGALLHGNVDWLKPGMIYKYAIPGEIVMIIVSIVVGIPVAFMLF